MEASARQLVRDGLDRHDAVALGFFALVKFASRFAIADRKVGRLDVRPSQEAVSVLGIAFPLFLAIGNVGAPHAAAIRCVVADIGEAADVSSLQ